MITKEDLNYATNLALGLPHNYGEIPMHCGKGWFVNTLWFQIEKIQQKQQEEAKEQEVKRLAERHGVRIWPDDFIPLGRGLLKRFTMTTSGTLSCLSAIADTGGLAQSQQVVHSLTGVKTFQKELQIMAGCLHALETGEPISESVRLYAGSSVNLTDFYPASTQAPLDPTPRTADWEAAIQAARQREMGALSQIKELEAEIENLRYSLRCSGDREEALRRTVENLITENKSLTENNQRLSGAVRIKNEEIQSLTQQIEDQKRSPHVGWTVKPGDPKIFLDMGDAPDLEVSTKSTLRASPATHWKLVKITSYDGELEDCPDAGGYDVALAPGDVCVINFLTQRSAINPAARTLTITDPSGADVMPPIHLIPGDTAHIAYDPKQVSKVSMEKFIPAPVYVEPGETLTVSYTNTFDPEGWVQHWDNIVFGKGVDVNVAELFKDQLVTTAGALDKLAHIVHLCNKKWWLDPVTKEPKERNVGEMLMLTCSELAEAMEGHRKSLPDDHLPQYPMFQVELVDAIIREFDILRGLKVMNIGEIFVAKMLYNGARADHKLEARTAPGGKKY